MAHLLILDDEPKMLEVLKEALERSGHEVTTEQDPVEGLRKAETGAFDVVVTDLRMPQLTGIEVLKLIKEKSPDTQVILLSAYATIETAVEATQAGAFDFIEKPVRLDVLRAKVAAALERQKLGRENRDLKDAVRRRYSHDAVIAESGAMQEVLRLARRAAESSATVLIRGESGTGKEVVARVIHFESARKTGPFIKLNCAAIPEGLLESELFGHEKGAFTGAIKSRPGKFEAAHTGTIFLDEIGELPFSLQAKILRVLQEREFERVGGNKTLQVDVRVIAATNRDLEAAVREKLFREDLYWRLNVVPILVPPLRDRPQDIAPLVQAALARGSKRLNAVSKEATALLTAYAWPGNVRELENVIERASVLSEGTELLPGDLPAAVREGTPKGAVPSRFPDTGLSLEQVERDMLAQALAKAGGNQTQAAKLLGLTRRRLGYRLQKFGLEPGHDKGETS